MYTRVTRVLPRDFVFWAKSLRGQYNLNPKNVNNVLNQNVNVTKLARFVIFAISGIVDNLSSLQYYEWNIIKIQLARLIIT